jgi:large subunit ribosomal protein L22
VEKEIKDNIAIAKFVRISPDKIRRVAKLIRGKHNHEAISILKALPHKGSELLLQVLNSAIANAVNNDKKDQKDLYVKEILIDEGVRWKRYMARARGRMYKLIKRTSHIKVKVGEIGG